jgi:tetratricopeptide (TPR) repeat protein
VKAIELNYLQTRLRKLLDILPGVEPRDYIEYSENPQIERQINELFLRKEFKKALQIAQHEIESYPFSLETRLLLAKIYLAMNQHQNSLEVLEQTESFHPSDPDILRLKATNWVETKQFDKAQKVYQKIKDTKDVELLWEMGYCCENQNNLTGAISYYKQALSLDPSHNKSLNSLLAAMSSLGQISLLVDYLGEIARAKPLNAYGWFNYSAALLAVGLYDQAQECLRDALALQHRESLFASALANLLCYKGEFNQALDWYDEIEQFDGTSTPLLCLKALCLEMLNKPQEAHKLYRKATELNPGFGWGWYGMGKTLNTLQKYHEAIFFLKKAIVLSPSFSDFWFELGVAEREAENFASSFEAFLQATFLEDESPQPWLELAYTYYLCEMRSQALDTILDGLEVLPDSVELNYLAGAYLFLTGKIKEGSLYMQSAASMDIDKHEILFKYFPQLEHRMAFLKAILGVNTF